MKTYKVTNKDMQCRGFQFELGKTYTTDQKPVRCGSSGFHSCKELIDCFKYYDFDPTNRVFECEIGGDIDIDNDDTKVASQVITLLRELTWHEVLDMVNMGKGNTGRGNSGYRNSGDLNSGDRNSGDGNSGYRNSGDLNSGDRNSGDGNSGYGNSGDLNSGDGNSGDRNSGDLNSGDRNSGDRNSGYRNSGDRNSGDRNSGYGNSGSLNSCNYSTGFFNSKEAPVYMFNKPTNLLRGEVNIPYIDLRLTEWVEYTDDEKANDPNKTLIGGHLKTYSYKEAWANWDKSAPTLVKNMIKSLPNYDADVFFEITGLDWRTK